MIKDKIKIIFKLSNIFLKNSYDNLNIINKKNNKLNKKSIILWMIIILVFAIFYISNIGIKFLNDKKLTDIFINIYFFIIALLIIFQTALVIINVFYFSKDIEYILPLPIKPTSILISKFICVIYRIYVFEAFFCIIPLTIYGIYNNSPPIFYLYEIIILAILPIFLSAMVCIVMMFFMKISKFIKNKDVFQIVITFFIISVMIGVQYGILGNILKVNNEKEIIQENLSIEKFSEFNKMKEVNKYFLVVNPSIDVLLDSNMSSIIKIIKIIIIDAISIIIFIFIGKKTYLKDILINTSYMKPKKTNKIKSNRKNKSISYIIKEFKTLYRNPMFFVQCIFPNIALTFSISLLVIKIIPQFRIWITDEEYRNYIGDLSFDITAVYIILGIIQFFFMITPISLIAVSKDGKKASFMKHIPISLYKQFVYKGIPQIVISLIPIFVFLTVIHIMIPEILLKYILEILILAILLNIINSYSMLIIDFLNPKINWDSEYEVMKQNKNKIFQYVFTVGIILLFVYLSDILKEMNIEMSILITGSIFAIFILLLHYFVKIKQKKLFNKII